MLLDAGGFDVALTSSEDRDLWIRCAMRSGVLLLGERLVRKRRHGSNMSSHAERQSRNIRAVLAKARAAGVVSASDIPFWTAAWSVYHYQTALMQQGGGRHLIALSHLAASTLLHPCFFHPSHFRQPAGFRLRAAARSVRSLLLPGGRK